MEGRYLVTTRKPTSTTATEEWEDELRAYLRGDVINATTGEYEGATVEVLTPPFTNEVEHFDFHIEYTWMDKRQLSDISCLIEVTPDISVYCDLEVRLNVDGDEISYVVELGETIYTDKEQDGLLIQLNRKTVELIQELISEDAEEREYFHQHESQEVTEANRRSFDDSHQDPNTI